MFRPGSLGRYWNKWKWTLIESNFLTYLWNLSDLFIFNDAHKKMPSIYIVFSFSSVSVFFYFCNQSASCGHSLSCGCFILHFDTFFFRVGRFGFIAIFQTKFCTKMLLSSYQFTKKKKKQKILALMLVISFRRIWPKVLFRANPIKHCSGKRNESMAELCTQICFKANK